MKRKFFKLAILIIFILSSFLSLRMLPIFCTNTDNNLFYNVAFNIQSFAKKHNKLFFSQKYKNEVEQYINNIIPKLTNKLDNTMKDFKNYRKKIIQNSFTNSLKNEYCNKIDEYETELDALHFYLYVELSRITDKYLLLPIGNIPTDNSNPYDEILSLYFARYKINDSKLKTFNLYFHKQYNELNNYRNQIKCSI